MGYRTNFTFHCDDERAAEIKAALVSKHHGTSPFGTDLCWNGGDGCKWYDRRKHCSEVAAMFPCSTFAVRGFGEDRESWVAAYRGEHLATAQLPRGQAPGSESISGPGDLADVALGVLRIPHDEWIAAVMVSP